MEAQLQKFVDTVDRWLTAEDIVINLEACLGCGNCGQACAWYVETGDERLHPKYRADIVRKVYRRYKTPTGKLLGALGLIESPTVEDLRRDMDVFWKCTACGRCTLACPAGISTRRLVRIARAAYTESGLAEENPTLRSIIRNTDELRHSFGLSVEEVFGRTALFLKYEGVNVPIDVHGAQYLFVCPAAGNTKIPDLGIEMMQVLNAAGVSYTVTPDVVDTGTEIDHITVHHQLSRQMLIEWEDAAEKLGVEAIIVAECGCDVRTLYQEATETLGRPFKFPIISVDSLFERLIDEGKLPVEPIEESVTFHDPCYVTRMSGQGEKYRRMMPKLTLDFREMTPNREYNYCCNAGSGGMRLPEQTELRRKVSRIKAEQIKATRAELVTTPCAVCYLSLKDTTEFYGIATPEPEGRRARMFFEVVYAAARKALGRRGELHRFRTPAVLQGKSPQYVRQHSITGLLDEWAQRRDFPELLARLRKDAIVQQFGKSHPGFDRFLDEFEQSLPLAAD